MREDGDKRILSGARLSVSKDSAKALETHYQWSEVPSIADVPGIYAWYYMPEITQFDICKLIESVQIHVSKGDTAVALSAVVLGLMIALAVKAPIAVAGVIVGLFAVFHGYAHGSELPGSVSAFAYAVGFVISTGLLHMAGIGFGVLVKWPAGRVVVRGLGGVISLAGLAFLAGVA